ncbi:MAG: SRPBCC family protein [Chloroflexi bacterium]|nr:SRPBCC family protein [Chloroflexota bacterium]
MHVINRHERTLPAPAAQVGALIDSLASKEDRLWPRDRWPAMRFDRLLGVGAVGGHGPIRYFVAEYIPGLHIKFQFTAPPGFNGWHGYTLEALDGQTTRLFHILEMRTSGPALLSWPLLFRPLHDALIEDSLDKAQSQLSGEPLVRQWSPYVRLLRRLLRPKTAHPSRSLRTSDS